MGETDIRTNEYMSDSDRFADIFNFFIYDGNQVINPEWLRELDRGSISFMFDNINAKSEIFQKYRDVFKLYAAKRDKNATYLLWGIENQTEINYAMPVRNMLYDAATYSKQIAEVAKSHRKKGKTKSGMNPDSGEFLGGFYRDDRLIPVITLVLFWSPERWDGPKSIHEMIEINDKRLLEYIPDYKINIVTPREISDKDFNKFNTPLAEALQFIKYSKNKKKLMQILRENEAYRHLDIKTAEVLRTVTNIKVTFPKEEKEANMCKAVEDLMKDAAREAAKEAAREATRVTTEKVTKSVTKETRDTTLMDSIRNLMDTMKMTAEQAMNALKIPERDQKRYAKLL